MRDGPVLDCVDGRGLGDEDSRRPGMPVHILLINQGRVDRGAFDHGSLRRKIPNRKADRRAKAARAGAVGSKNHVVRVDAIERAEPSLQ